jgi:hypothetical protein
VYLTVILVLLLLAFLGLCFIGLLTLLREAIANPPFTAPQAFVEDSSRAAAAALAPASASAAASEDAEGNACG